MAHNGDGPGDYVRQVRESTQQYARDLLSENEKLSALNASLSAEKARLEHDLGQASERDKQNAELRSAVEALVAERVRLVEQSAYFRDQLTRERDMHAALVQELAEAEESTRTFAERYESVEQQNSNLANLYVASFRLHGCLDRESVLATVQEIVINIIGSEQFAILERESNGTSLRLASSFGIDAARLSSDHAPMRKIAEVVAEGMIYVAPSDQPPGDSPLACVPLRIGERVIGAVAIFRLLEHKAHLESLDHELFNLLATHAATALYCSELHARFGHRWRESG
jgi:GAF domain-containing protein